MFCQGDISTNKPGDASTDERRDKASRPTLTILMLAFLLALSTTIVATSVAGIDARPLNAASARTSAAVPSDCPVTPYTSERVDDHFTTTWYGNDNLWAGLDAAYEGRWYAGSEPLKVQWQLPRDAALSIEGKRLDAPSPPLAVETAPGRGRSSIGDLQASFMQFPSDGCWQVTARIPSTELRFVVFVHPVGEKPIAAMSTPAPGAWDRLRHPLDSSNFEADESCPTTATETVPRVAGITTGSGPVFIQGFDQSGVLPLDDATTTDDGKLFTLRLIVSPEYSGPLLIRGDQLVGDGELRFGGPTDEQEAHLLVNDVSTPDWWLASLRDIRIPGPGCYALQIDGLTFSEVIVFDARTGNLVDTEATPIDAKTGN